MSTVRLSPLASEPSYKAPVAPGWSASLGFRSGPRSCHSVTPSTHPDRAEWPVYWAWRRGTLSRSGEPMNAQRGPSSSGRPTSSRRNAPQRSAEQIVAISGPGGLSSEDLCHITGHRFAVLPSWARSQRSYAIGLVRLDVAERLRGRRPPGACPTAWRSMNSPRMPPATPGSPPYRR